MKFATTPHPPPTFDRSSRTFHPGRSLYRMYGKARPDAKQVYIGSVILESGFVASEFGDRILAFRHAVPTQRP